MLTSFGVAIASNGRCAPLLRHLVERWVALGARVAVAGGTKAVLAVLDLPHVDVVETSDVPQKQGDQIASAMEALDAKGIEFVLRCDDDVLPLGDGDDWVGRLILEPGTLRAIAMIDLLGRRWFDWAVRAKGATYRQPYDQHLPGTFVTGAAQLWSREARRLVSYRGRAFRTGADARVCEEAERAGIKLCPPSSGGPVLVHLDRTPDFIRDVPSESRTGTGFEL